MAPDIDFTSLSVEEALDVAIAVEVEARQRYLEFVDMMVRHHTEEAADFFRKMADRERGHAERLRKLRIARFGDEPGPAAHIPPPEEVEAPGYEEVRAFMTVHRALEVSLTAEQNAERFYARALDRIEEPEVSALFAELRDQEVRHQQIIEEFRSKLPDEDPGDPDDYVDEPRAQ